MEETAKAAAAQASVSVFIRLMQSLVVQPERRAALWVFF